MAYLRRSGVVAPEPTQPRANRPSVLARFADWMRQHRGVTESTLRSYEPILLRFVEAHGDDARRFDAVALRAFVLEQVPRGAESAKSAVTALRMFVRYRRRPASC
jgi:site-specific recombinase XerD